MKKIIYIFISLAVIIAVVACLWYFCSGNDGKAVYGDTAVSINGIELKGELYLYSEIIEDYAIERVSEKRIWPLPDKQHAQMRIKNKRMSYVLPLDSILVEQVGSKLIVTLPEPMVKSSEQALGNITPYLSDDDEYWEKNPGNVGEMVDKKIAERFTQSDKKDRAMANARNTLRTLYEAAGFGEVEFRGPVSNRSAQQ